MRHEDSDNSALRFVSSASFMPQDHIVESGWIEHGAFAGWLAQVLSPGIFVELGTHNGFSYFSFCQAVDRFGLGTSCFAVDTWVGDEHASHYGEDVYKSVVAANEKYRGFSTLIRLKFEEALDYFADGSIDLLHIDGRHYYEDVRSDYETWAKKLSKNAVVLFHDTNVRERDFGVWRFFAELKESHQTFEFIHGHGLGIVALGETPPVLTTLLHAKKNEVDAVRSVYAQLGTIALHRFRTQQATAGLSAARLAYADLQGLLDGKNSALAEAETYARDLERELDARSRALSELETNALAAHTPNATPDGDPAVSGSGPSNGVQISAEHPLRQEAEAPTSLWSWLPKPFRRVASPLSAPHPEAGHDGNGVDPHEAEGDDDRAEPDIKEQIVLASRRALTAFLESDDTIDLRPKTAPVVTVVIVLWNKAHFTLGCLKALADNVRAPLQVVIVDNGSNDETRRLLDKVVGLDVITNQENKGFVVACNQGAAAAKTPFLLLLNNDACVRRHAIETALATIQSQDNVGVVGSRLILPNGLAQEGGSIVWSDGSCLGYGRGWAPTKSELMFRRDVDYCSGAFLLTRMSVWTRLDGFDEAYSPAYYEEADYCMRVHAAGFRVVYEPDSIVDHFEFGSTSGSDLSTKLMIANRKRFRMLHHGVLETAHLPPLPANVLAARSHRGSPRRRMLFIDNMVPVGIEGAGFPRAREILVAALALDWEVSLFPMEQLDIDWSLARSEIPPEIEIIGDSGWMRLGEFLAERAGYYEVIMISRPENMRKCLSVVADGVFDSARLVYDAEAVFASRVLRRATVEGTVMEPSEADALIKSELALADRADAISCVSSAEAAFFEKAYQKPVVVLSHTSKHHDDMPAFAQRSGFLFVGRLLENDTPNWLGLSWFVKECWPHVRARLPNATLTVVGRLHEDHEDLVAPGIDFLGGVPDVTPYYARARVFIAPIQFAAGIPLKIVEAALASVPCAGTTLMAELLQWQPGRDLVAENEPLALATAISELHEDADTWNRIRLAAIERASRDYSVDAFRNSLKTLLGCGPASNDHGKAA